MKDNNGIDTMNINKVTIENIKGISHFELNQPLLPNRPNILVAPNGFGKSSLATAFLSLSRGKINLKPEDFYMEESANAPTVKLEISNGDVLLADSSLNTILNVFSVFVVNNQLIPNATAQHFGKVIVSKASLDIKPTEIIDKIPVKVPFSYNISNIKREFGPNHKVLMNIKSIYANTAIVHQIEDGVNMHIFDLKPYNKAINQVINFINGIPAIKNTSEIKNIIRNKKLFDIGIPEYVTICTNIRSVMNYTDDIDAFLSGWQYIRIRQNMKCLYAKAIAYGDYLIGKTEIDLTLDNINPVKQRFRIRTTEHKGKLIIDWPKANQVSNGERDIMVFIAKLLECEYKSKNNCVLIIDEFFDYLDDANLVAFQYFVSTLIDKFKKQKKLIFPILLTHLDPNYLKHFCFNDKRMNVCYLKKTNAKISNEMIKIIQKREDPLIKNELDTYYFHYNPNCSTINITTKFSSLGLNKDWGTPAAFKKKVDRQLRAYCLQPNDKFDPLAVCISVRIRIEELVYNNLNICDQSEFISTHSTIDKLLLAQNKGVFIPETYFLLGIIYNHPLHNANEDMSRPLGMKLDNPIIRNMIYELWK